MANLGNIAMLAELDGALLVDKPVGISAHDLMKAVKTCFNLVKIGHGGTLEASARGLFVLLLGDATRFSNDLMGADRVYRVKCVLGKETDTCDRSGNTLSEKPADGITGEKFDAAFKEWRGDIYQAPPEFSAVKIPGKSGYEIVRTAEGDELREKLVHVYRYSDIEFENRQVSFTAAVTKNVSMRALVRDIGRTLGCGACVEDCQRLKCGKFLLEDALPFMKLMEMHPADLPSRVVPVRGGL